LAGAGDGDGVNCVDIGRVGVNNVDIVTPLGEFELLVLLAVARLKDDAYAVPVREEIEARTGRAAPRGSVYITLERLTRKGCLREVRGDGGAVRGGRPKRLFSVTPAGFAAAKGALIGLRRMQQGLEWVPRG
jgi:PadR family transcriptional regulator PadR